MAQKKVVTNRRAAPGRKPKTVKADLSRVEFVMPDSAFEATSEEEIARIAYTLWEDRGKPVGSPEQDWYEARARLGTQ